MALDRLLRRRWVQALLFAVAVLLFLCLWVKEAHARANSALRRPGCVSGEASQEHWPPTPHHARALPAFRASSLRLVECHSVITFSG